jgi:hypothetical protein
MGGLLSQYALRIFSWRSPLFNSKITGTNSISFHFQACMHCSSIVADLFTRDIGLVLDLYVGEYFKHSKVLFLLGIITFETFLQDFCSPLCVAAKLSRIFARELQEKELFTL